MVTWATLGPFNQAIINITPFTLHTNNNPFVWSSLFYPNGNMKLIRLGWADAPALGRVMVNMTPKPGGRYDNIKTWILKTKRLTRSFIMRLSKEIIRLFVLFSVLAGGWMCRVCCFLILWILLWYPDSTDMSPVNTRIFWWYIIIQYFVFTPIMSGHMSLELMAGDISALSQLSLRGSASDGGMSPDVTCTSCVWGPSDN